MSAWSAWTPDARVLVIALILDLAIGEPPNRFHPVAWLGDGVTRLVSLLPTRGRVAQLVAGAALVTVTVGVAAAVAWIVAALGSGLARASNFDTPGPPPGVLAPLLSVANLLVTAVCLKTTFAVRALGQANAQVQGCLQAGDLAGAREALGSLCSREASGLTSSQVAAASIESVAENLSDSVVAPLLFYIFLGLPGAAIYRAANTLDAMIGYHGHYEYLGKTAARFDDLLNWIPARVTAVLLLCSGAFRGRVDVRNGLRVLVRDGGSTESPNAGRPMAAMAGLLRVALAKPGHYHLGPEGRPATARDLGVAWSLVRDAAFLAAAYAVFAILLVHPYARFWVSSTP